MTIFIYVTPPNRSAMSSTSRCSRMPPPRKRGSRRMIRKAWRSNMRLWTEPHRAPDCLLRLASVFGGNLRSLRSAGSSLIAAKAPGIKLSFLWMSGCNPEFRSNPNLGNLFPPLSRNETFHAGYIIIMHHCTLRSLPRKSQI